MRQGLGRSVIRNYLYTCTAAGRCPPGEAGWNTSLDPYQRAIGRQRPHIRRMRHTRPARWDFVPWQVAQHVMQAPVMALLNHPAPGALSSDPRHTGSPTGGFSTPDASGGGGGGGGGGSLSPNPPKTPKH